MTEILLEFLFFISVIYMILTKIQQSYCYCYYCLIKEKQLYVNLLQFN